MYLGKSEAPMENVGPVQGCTSYRNQLSNFDWLVFTWNEIKH